ncbi:hypothetical protein [Bradyrhizobium sp. SEMIA]|uniref:hypothetical protein n=1 Tax=Bradyrhizobium sp. SEMIA TaxID=2597515 RepID=UPI0018A522C0|nr:hypothetical protein [Bradyrhizobium sp. SEMIA]QOG20446.1 hypothetical protein FOM02_26935 [Bradyrhizobium sp. SEMIA]
MASANLRKALAAALRRVPHVMNDIAGFAGAGLIAYGAWLIFVPAGFLVGGTLLMLLSVLFGRKLERD